MRQSKGWQWVSLHQQSPTESCPAAPEAFKFPSAQGQRAPSSRECPSTGTAPSPSSAAPSSRHLPVFVYESISLAQANGIDTLWQQRTEMSAENRFSTPLGQGGGIPIHTQGCSVVTVSRGLSRVTSSTPCQTIHASAELLAQQQHQGPSNTKHSLHFLEKIW